jgi:lipoate-protein ligase B
VDARGITRHGFALNVSPDMSYWAGIVACGLENQNKVSMAMLLDTPPKVEQVGRAAAEKLAQRLGLRLSWAQGIPPGA